MGAREVASALRHPRGGLGACSTVWGVGLQGVCLWCMERLSTCVVGAGAPPVVVAAATAARAARRSRIRRVALHRKFFFDTMKYICLHWILGPRLEEEVEPGSRPGSLDAASCMLCAVCARPLSALESTACRCVDRGAWWLVRAAPRPGHRSWTWLAPRIALRAGRATHALMRLPWPVRWPLRGAAESLNAETKEPHVSRLAPPHPQAHNAWRIRQSIQAKANCDPHVRRAIRIPSAELAIL